MLYVRGHHQWLIKEHLFAFCWTDSVPDPVLLNIPLIPLEAGTFAKLLEGIRHGLCIHQIYTAVKAPGKGMEGVRSWVRGAERGPGQQCAAGLAFWPDKERENITHQRVDGSVTLCRSREDGFLGLNELCRNKLVAAFADEISRALRGGLEVELKADNVSPELESLVLAGVAPSQVNCPGRQIKRFPVPMKDHRLFRELKSVLYSRDGYRGNRAPPNLLFGISIHAGTHGGFDQLR